MPPLSVQDPQLAANDRVTLNKLLQLGSSSSGTPYSFSAEALRTNGLSTNALVALVRASVPKLMGSDGTELRPKTFVAKVVTVHDSGAADLTLALDLAS